MGQGERSSENDECRRRVRRGRSSTGSRESTARSIGADSSACVAEFSAHSSRATSGKYRKCLQGSKAARNAGNELPYSNRQGPAGGAHEYTDPPHTEELLMDEAAHHWIDRLERRVSVMNT